MMVRSFRKRKFEIFFKDMTEHLLIKERAKNLCVEIHSFRKYVFFSELYLPKACHLSLRF